MATAKRRSKKFTAKITRMGGPGAGRRRKARARKKGQIPLPVLTRRLKRLSNIVATRGGPKYKAA